jgi:hypothetical protein
MTEQDSTLQGGFVLDDLVVGYADLRQRRAEGRQAADHHGTLQPAHQRGHQRAGHADDAQAGQHEA